LSTTHSKSLAESGGKQVCFQVTGIRQDPWAKAHPTSVEQDKGIEHDFYVQPQVYDQPAARDIQWARKPDWMQRLRELKVNTGNLDEPQTRGDPRR
jgi:hypothetical protein